METDVKKKRGIAIAIAVLIVALLFLLGPGMAFTIEDFLGITRDPGTRDVTINLQIDKQAIEVINPDLNGGVMGYIGKMGVNHTSSTINLGSDITFSQSTPGYCTPIAQEYYYQGVGYGYHDQVPIFDGPLDGYGYYSLRYVGGSPGIGYGYTDGYGMTQFLSGYGYGDSGKLNCEFTFTNLEEGVYSAIQVRVNGIPIANSDGAVTEVFGEDYIFGILNTPGTNGGTLNFVSPQNCSGMICDAVSMVKLVVDEADEDFVTVDIDTSIATSPSNIELKGSAFAFGPVQNISANLEINYVAAGLASSQLSRMSIQRFDGTNWNTVASGSNLTLDGDFVKAPITSFSSYALGLSSTTTGGSSSTTPAVTTTDTTTTDPTATVETVYEETKTISDEELSEVLSGMTDSEGNALFTESEVAEMLANSSEYEFEVTTKVEKITASDGTVSYRTTITTTITNSSGKNQRNVKVVVEVPKSVANSAQNITSNTPFTVLRDNPVLEFTVAQLNAGETKTIDYAVTTSTEPNLAGVTFNSPAVKAAEEVITPPVDDDDMVVCPTVWEPVCGSDGVTYSNECFANVAGVSVAYQGECVDDAPITEDAPMDWTLIIIALLVLLVVIGVAYVKRDDIKKMLKK